MSLLTPAFLIGLAALAVPLLIHLIRRERHDAVEFPSLMFLSRIPQPVVKRRHIRNWWLFALRCLALILLVGAFARPFVARGPDALAQVDAAREVVILIDRSYSMGYGDRWDRAVAAAREAINGLGTEDRASLVVFDAGATAIMQPTTERARLLSALDTLRVSAGVTSYTPALKLAQSILSASALERRDAVLISDFQRSGWDGAAGAQLPAGAVLRPVHIAGAATGNITVTHVTLDRARVGDRERISPVAHLSNSGESAANVAVSFEVDERTLQTVQAAVPAGGTSAVQLDPVTLDERALRATVRTGGDALPADDAFHFMLEAAPGLRVLVIEPSGRDASLYLRRALELAEDPPFAVTIRRGGAPTAAELERTDVVVLNDVVPPDGDAGRRLIEWIRAGGGLVLATGDRTSAAAWSDAAREIGGGVPEAVVDRVDDGGARLGFLEYSHPVFELFRAPRAGAFGAARFYRYRPVPAADARAAGDTSSTGATILARFDDGAVALVERPIGEGRALVWGSTLDSYWTNLALEPIYLPLMHQIVKRAAGFTPARPWSTAGQIVDVAVADDVPLVVNTPAGGRIEIAAANTLVALEEQGFYEVREARAGGSTLREHAVNVDVAESDLSVVDPTELVSALTATASDTRRNASVSLAPEEQEKRQALWWYLLLVVFALLAAEAVLANRRAARPALR
ncbi:MAG TPA: BatA and WFA domain-containing protein [Longimicrobiales bacterium]|nr:BatA and WFA domain-containing protein [Longimicrobiales bacterium]